MIRRIVAMGISALLRITDTVRDAIGGLRGQPPRSRAVVLYYHAVTAEQRERFAWQLRHLVARARTFRADTPEHIAETGLHAAVTFDDGFVSVVEHALPELEAHGIPCVMFVPTGCLGQRPSWIPDSKHPSWREQVLSVDQLRAVAQHPLVTVGSHSVTHPNFLMLDEAAARSELRESKLGLERILGRPVTSFSFPHGAHDDRLLHLAGEAGYERVFTVAPTLVQAAPCTFAFGRVAVTPDDWRAEFSLKLAGAYRWRVWARRLRGRSAGRRS